MEFLNPDSVQKIEGAKIEPILASAQKGETFQFLRKGYFCVDKTSSADRIVFNRTVALRDTWKKLMKQQKGK
jgi:glutaminyl-tRNA synthetase